MLKKMLLPLLLLSTLNATHAAILTSQFPLEMENHTTQDTWLTFKEDIGHVYFDEPMEDHTLLAAGRTSTAYGVIFAPRNPEAKFKIHFENQETCTFTVGFFTPPEPPKVTFSGDGCKTAGYRVEKRVGYSPLILFI